MNIVNIAYFKTPYGELIFGAYRDQLCLCDWRYRKMRSVVDKRIQNGLHASFQEEEKDDTLQKTRQQLQEYFNGTRTMFDIPLLLTGTSFQQNVWNELLKIPFGKTTTYLELSHKLNNQKAIRAVAAANGANAISIIVPCHRVIGSNGELTGYAGGLNTKKKLLALEKGLPVAEQLELQV